MNENELINKTVLYDIFTGRATPLQKQMVADWMAKNENLEYYHLCLEEWENDNIQFIPTYEKGFEKVKHKIEVEKVCIPEKQNVKIRFSFFVRKNAIVASILLIFLFAITLSLGDKILKKTVTAGYGETKYLVLPDGSEVTLNANSSLQYSRFRFSKGDRIVYLMGEADFSVKHTKDNQKFFVKTKNNVTISVLGTEFTAYVRNQSRVVLRSGKIELTYLNKQVENKIIMKPGELFETNDKKVVIKHIKQPETYALWKNHKFLFDNTTLNEVAQIFKDNYNLTISFESKELSERSITGTFQADDSDELLEAIAQILDIDYKRTNNQNIFLFEN